MHNQLFTIVLKLTNSFRYLNEQKMCDVGLHSGQAQVLSVLWKEDGLSQAEIVRELNISPPTVNTLVNKLEKNRYVKLKKSRNDKRLVRVYLTKKGLSKRSETEKQWLEIEEEVLKNLSDTEKVLALMLLEKIKNSLQSVNS